MRKSIKTLLIILLLWAAFTGIGLAQEEANSAEAELVDSSGNIVGKATFTENDDGVTISVTVNGLSDEEGEYGIHIHEIGKCTPDFSAAGGHFNPTGDEHGLDNPNGPHAGDNPNLETDAEGNADYLTVNDRITLASGENSLFDEDGSALVIHAGPDDQITDPTGESGDRIACGVIMSDKEAAPTAEATSEATAEATQEAEPTVEAAQEAEPTVEAAQEAEPTVEAAQEAEPTVEATQEAPPHLPQSGGANYTPLVLLILGTILSTGGILFYRKRWAA